MTAHLDAATYRSCAHICRRLADRFEAAAEDALLKDKLRELAAKALPLLLNVVAPTPGDVVVAKHWMRSEVRRVRRERTGGA